MIWRRSVTHRQTCFQAPSSQSNLAFICWQHPAARRWVWGVPRLTADTAFPHADSIIISSGNKMKRSCEQYEKNLEGGRCLWDVMTVFPQTTCHGRGMMSALQIRLTELRSTRCIRCVRQRTESIWCRAALLFLASVMWYQMRRLFVLWMSSGFPLKFGNWVKKRGFFISPVLG